MKRGFFSASAGDRIAYSLHNCENLNRRRLPGFGTENVTALPIMRADVPQPAFAICQGSCAGLLRSDPMISACRQLKIPFLSAPLLGEKTYTTHLWLACNAASFSPCTALALTCSSLQATLQGRICSSLDFPNLRRKPEWVQSTATSAPKIQNSAKIKSVKQILLECPLQ